MEVLDFNKKAQDLTKVSTVTIVWKDDSDAIEVEVTAFGNAEGSSRMLVFYNDNLSEAPILIVNEENIKYVELTPLEDPDEYEEEAEYTEPTH